jgi:hypothetical protein
MSSKHKSIFSDKLHDDIVREYFDVMATGKSLYIAMILRETQKEDVFYEGGDPKKRAICRVFFRKSDLNDYKDLVAMNHDIPIDYVRSWETDFKNLSEFFVKFNKKLKKDGIMGVEAVCTTSYQGRIRQVDVFWSEDKENMV